jgi:hypothetical protein
VGGLAVSRRNGTDVYDPLAWDQFLPDLDRSADQVVATSVSSDVGIDRAALNRAFEMTEQLTELPDHRTT